MFMMLSCIVTTQIYVQWKHMRSQLRLNVVTSNAMFIGSHQRIAGKSLNVSVGGTVLNQVKSVRYLDILIDPTLS